MCVLHVKAVWLSQGCSSWSLSLHNRGLGLSIWPSVCICVCLHLCVCVIHCFCNVPNPFFIPLWKSYRIMLILPFTSRGKLDCHLISYRLWLILLFFFFCFSSCILHQQWVTTSVFTSHQSQLSSQYTQEGSSWSWSCPGTPSRPHCAKHSTCSHHCSNKDQQRPMEKRGAPGKYFFSVAACICTWIT